MNKERSAEMAPHHGGEGSDVNRTPAATSPPLAEEPYFSVTTPLSSHIPALLTKIR